jgi:phage-related protein
MIKSLYDLEKNISKAFTKSEKFKNVLEALQMVFVKLTAPITAFVTKLGDAIKKFTEATTPVDKLDGALKGSQASVTAMAEKFEMLLPVLASVGTAFGVLAGKQIFAMVPVLGSVMSKLSPLPVALVVLALTSTQVRNAMLNLLSALKPILPIFVQLGKIMGAVSVVAVALLAKGINLVAGAVRGVIGFVQTNIGLFKALAIVIGILAIGYAGYRATILLTTAATWLYGAAVTAITVVTGAFTTAQRILNATMAYNPIPLMIGAIIALMVAFGYLIKTNKDVAKVVGVVFNFIIKTVIYVLAYIVKAIGYMLKAFAMWIRVLGFVAEVIAKVFEFIIDVVLTYYQFQLKVIKFIVDAFINLMESHGILYDVVKAIFNGIIKVISLVVEGIIRTLALVVGAIADLVGVFNDLFRGVKNIFLKILSAIGEVGSGIFGVLNKIAEGIGEFLGWAFDKMTAWIRGIAALFSKIPKIGDMVAGAINSGLDATKNVVTGFAKGMVGLGEKMFDGIIKGTTNTVNGISTIGDAVEKGLRATEKTLTKFAVKVQEFGGQDNGAKIIDALVTGAKTASSALGKMIDVIQDVKDFDFARTVGNFIDGMAEKADAAGEFLIGLSASMMEFADNTDFASAVGDGIGDFINKIKDSLKEGLGFGDILKEEEKKKMITDKIQETFAILAKELAAK